MGFQPQGAVVSTSSQKQPESPAFLSLYRGALGSKRGTDLVTVSGLVESDCPVRGKGLEGAGEESSF